MRRELRRVVGGEILIVMIHTPSSHLTRVLVDLQPHVRKDAGDYLSYICPAKFMLCVSAGLNGTSYSFYSS